MKVLNGNNQNGVISDLINQAVRETVRSATADAFGEWIPSIRILKDSLHGPLDLRGELVTETFTLKIVIGHGLDEFGFGRIEKIDPHGFCRLILSNTRIAGVALIFP